MTLGKCLGQDCYFGPYPWLQKEDSAFGSVADVLAAFAELEQPFEASLHFGSGLSL